MNDARTVVSGDIIAGNHAESALAGIHPGDELAVVHANEFRTHVGADHFIGHQFVTGLVVGKGKLFCLGVEHRVEQRLGHNHRYGLAIVFIICAHHAILDAGADAEGCVGGKGPGGCRPCYERRSTPPRHVALGVGDFKLSDTGGVFNIAVAAGLVQLVRAEAGAGRGRIWLDCISFVKIAFAVKLGKEPPHRFDVSVVVSDVRLGEVHPVAHIVGERFPLTCKFHHLAAACIVVFIDRNLVSDVLFGDAETFLHAEFDRQAVGVPAGLALHLEAFHRLVTAEDVLDGAGHHMVDARHAVCRGRTLEKHKGWSALAHLHTLFKKMLCIPCSQHLFVDFREIKPCIFGEFLHDSVEGIFV